MEYKKISVRSRGSEKGKIKLNFEFLNNENSLKISNFELKILKGGD